ncbi:MAG: NADH-quinone oxidoreductase subunit NuoH [Verrucomicrobiae bacterium]|nr:NADH-quinone oxidoreductase subunit NuoH [Verrucomicrobiae bacterium]
MSPVFSNLLAQPGVALAAEAAVKIAVVIVVLMGMVAYTVLAERRICALIQDRLGPNRVGAFGLLQPIADSFKLLLKENVLPGHVNRFWYVLAPTIAMAPPLLTLAVIPFGNTLAGFNLVIADLDVGVLWIFSIASLGVYGIVLAGWASNSKYPFLGGMRSAAQLISYEVPMGLSVVSVFLLVGSLKLSNVVAYQAGTWLIFKAPLAFLIFLVSAFAETNRLPFDLPEAEQELVGGYNTEYGQMKFALFFLAEYANMIVASALIVTLFFGGWQVPFVRVEAFGPILAGALGVAAFFVKLLAFIVFFIWVRWTLPRFRYDQLMRLGWRVLLPLALLNIVATALALALKLRA